MSFIKKIIRFLFNDHPVKKTMNQYYKQSSKKYEETDWTDIYLA